MAGITINYVMGDNSIFRKATEAKLQTDIAKSREKLEVTFGHAKLLKHTDKGYNQDDYLDELMTKEILDIEIKGDIVIVDGYVFEIDRNEPKIGQYVGKESELVFPEITVNVTLAEDAKTATIHITAKESKNGISKIEIIQGGYVLETYECENVKEEVVKDYIAKQNGTYTIKVYAGLTVSEKIKVEGLIASVEYSPNGNEEYKKEHQVKVSVKETKEKVKSIKYQWLATTVEPEADTFTEICSNNGTITGKDYTGTYYLWTLIETESGKTNIGRSEGFNFDNEGPIVNLTSTPISLTSFKLTATAQDSYTGLTKYKFYVNDKLEYEIETDKETVEFTVSEANTGNINCYVIVQDELKNETEKRISARTQLYTWDRYGIKETSEYQLVKGNTYSAGTCGIGDGMTNCYKSVSVNKQTGAVTYGDIYGGNVYKGDNTSWWEKNLKHYSATYTGSSRMSVEYTQYSVKQVTTNRTKDTTKKYSSSTSTTSNTYPKNGISGEYWYVYVGIK